MRRRVTADVALATVESGSRRRGRSVLALARRALRATPACVVAGAASRSCGGTWWIASLGPAPLGEALAFSTAGASIATAGCCGPTRRRDGRWRLPATRDGCRSALPRHADRLRGQALPRHHGVDPLALGARGLRSCVANGRIVSGGSTLTMQVARLLEPRSERSFTAKLRQMVRAVAARARALARTRSSRSISASRPMAAISKACAPPRSPISARSRGG